MPEKFVLLHAEDNVLVCCRKCAAGDAVTIDGHAVSLASDIDVGHKIARRDSMPGDIVVKYGAPIGSFTRQTRRGDHVHTDNMKSDYIPGHTRTGRVGEGDNQS
jgi:hypothetical protein